MKLFSELKTQRKFFKKSTRITSNERPRLSAALISSYQVPILEKSCHLTEGQCIRESYTVSPTSNVYFRQDYFKFHFLLLIALMCKSLYHRLGCSLPNLKLLLKKDKTQEENTPFHMHLQCVVMICSVL